MQEHYSVAVACVKTLLFIAIAEQGDATVREHAVAVHQEKPYARSTPLYISYLLHRLMHFQKIYGRKLPRAASAMNQNEDGGAGLIAPQLAHVERDINGNAIGV